VRFFSNEGFPELMLRLDLNSRMRTFHGATLPDIWHSGPVGKARQDAIFPAKMPGMSMVDAK
jgi:hypothetical protein